VVFGGLPGVGKTVIAKELARQTGALYLRIDSIEQALRDSGGIADSVNDAGYLAAYAIAGENLCLGHHVIADCVNPLQLTRESWRKVAQQSGVEILEVEVLCSNPEEHRHRVERRDSDIPGLKLPTWQEVLDRNYEPWDREHVVVDSAIASFREAVAEIRRFLEAPGAAGLGSIVPFWSERRSDTPR
jgi:predicted kinase